MFLPATKLPNVFIAKIGLCHNFCHLREFDVLVLYCIVLVIVRNRPQLWMVSRQYICAYYMHIHEKEFFTHFFSQGGIQSTPRYQLCFPSSSIFFRSKFLFWIENLIQLVSSMLNITLNIQGKARAKLNSINGLFFSVLHIFFLLSQ